MPVCVTGVSCEPPPFTALNQWHGDKGWPEGVRRGSRTWALMDECWVEACWGFPGPCCARGAEGVARVWSQVPQEMGVGIGQGQLWAPRTALCKRKVISSLVSLNNFLVPETSNTFLKELHVALWRAEISCAHWTCVSSPGSVFVPFFVSISFLYGDLCFWKCHPFCSPVSSGLYLDGVVLSLCKSFLQSHRVVEISLKEIGPTCFYNAVEMVSAQTLYQTNWNWTFAFCLPLYHS